MFFFRIPSLKPSCFWCFLAIFCAIAPYTEKAPVHNSPFLIASSSINFHRMNSFSRHFLAHWRASFNRQASPLWIPPPPPCRAAFFQVDELLRFLVNSLPERCAPLEGHLPFRASSLYLRDVESLPTPPLQHRSRLRTQTLAPSIHLMLGSMPSPLYFFCPFR